MNDTVSVLFYIKRSKANNEGTCLIYVIVTIQSKRFEFSANKFVNPDKWSSEGAKVKSTNEEARTINSHLDYLKNQVSEAGKKLFKKDIKVTTENFKNKLFNLSETKDLKLQVYNVSKNNFGIPTVLVSGKTDAVVLNVQYTFADA